MNLAFPYHIDGTGRTAATNEDTHLRDLIAQVLFTTPGERVMRPDFGSGLAALTFEPNSVELAATTEFLVQGSLQQWLGDWITVEAVEITPVDGTLTVTVRYAMTRTGHRGQVRLTAPGDPAMTPSRGGCAHRHRLQVLRDRAKHGLDIPNAIEYLEVRDRDEPNEALRQRTLFVHLLKDAPELGAAQVRIDGGQQIPSVAVEWAAPAEPPPAQAEDGLLDRLEEAERRRVLVVRTATRGDFSNYVLRLVTEAGEERPHPDFDPLLAQWNFSFKVECATDVDCRSAPQPEPPGTLPGQAVDYLAKDYLGFRRLLLDRLPLDGNGKHPAAVGVALAELLAYVADQLSYRQDAIATEAYLGTARSRVSLRRHARLVDYQVHEGCTAQVWIRITVTGSLRLSDLGSMLTRTPGLPDVAKPGDPAIEAAVAAGAKVFLPVRGEGTLYEDHNKLHFYTWGEPDCELSAGATAATLAGRHPFLKAGDVLILTEIATDTPAGAIRRHAIQLTHVEDTTDPSGGLFEQPPREGEVAVTEIRWEQTDALPFALPLAHDRKPAALAWGNIIHAFYLGTADWEDLPVVPNSPAPYRPRLARGPLLHTGPPTHERSRQLFQTPHTQELLDDLERREFTDRMRVWFSQHGIIFRSSVTVRGGPDLWSIRDPTQVYQLSLFGDTLHILRLNTPAARRTTPDPRATVPIISVVNKTDRNDSWWVRPDLLTSGSDDAVFTVETEHDGTVWLRFGDGTHGRRPAQGTRFQADYAVGAGPDGNVGAETITHVVTASDAVREVTNPLSAVGGMGPQSAEQIRQEAPQAFAFVAQQRAVTPADYAGIAARFPGVQRAYATWRWTGSWYTVFVAVDRAGGYDLDAAFIRDLQAHLKPYRMAGGDVRIVTPRYVPLDIAVEVCVRPSHRRSQVRQALLDVLGGRRGLFHPDELTFAQPVYLSRLYATAQAVPGVTSVDVTTFRRQGQPDPGGLTTGVLPMGPLEIARLDVDPNRPGRGRLALTLGGGL